MEYQGIIDYRRTECTFCSTRGVRVDTTAGEIVWFDHDGEPAPIYAPDTETWLMVDECGRVTCDEHADE